MKPAVRVEKLGKLFHHSLPRFDTLLGRFRRRALPPGIEAATWALRDVSFSVERGECFGIYGPNGAGKSTLLSLIAGIYEPTEGSIEIEGRTNAFLNLHAALHPELSVLDNIEIGGVLMGLRRNQVRRRLEAILDYAGMAGRAEVRMAELSSGQVARVAFSTAIHADLDILLVDEALSVGDAEFQSKCEQTFERLRREGSTILTVSHDKTMLERISGRRLHLNAGRGEVVGEAPEGRALAKRVLFIGNSFTRHEGGVAAALGGVPGLCAALRAGQTPEIAEHTVAVSGQSLEGHWNAGQAVRAIRSGRWDYVVLQEESSRPAKEARVFEKYLRLFDEEARKSGGKTVVLMTWAKQGERGSQPDINASYERAAASAGVVLAPAGPAWEAALRERPDFKLHSEDGLHASALGMLVAACVVVRTVLGEAPVVSNAVREALARSGEPISPEDARFIESCILGV